MAELILSAVDFKTLSSGTRLQIIKLLSTRNHNLTELSARLKLSAPSIKQHIDVLLASDLIVQIESAHKWKYYTLSRKGKRLVEPYSSQVLIVLSTSLVGILGIALIASSIFGFQTLTSSAGSAPALRDSVKAFGPPVASEASKIASTTVSNQAAQPLVQTVTQQSSLNPLLFLMIGAILLVFAFLIYKRKIRLFR